MAYYHWCWLWAPACLSGFFPYKVTFLPSHCALRKEVLCAWHTRKGLGIPSPLLEGRVSTSVIWNSSAWICFFLSNHSITHSFTSVWAPGYLAWTCRKRQEGFLLLPVRVQRRWRTEALMWTQASLITLKVSLTHQAHAYNTELPAAITMQSPTCYRTLGSVWATERQILSPPGRRPTAHVSAHPCLSPQPLSEQPANHMWRM